MVFFISLCSSLLAPFRCNEHPNSRWTVQAYHAVYCNGEDEHQAMAVVGGGSQTAHGSGLQAYKSLL